VLFWTAGVSVATGLLFGVGPALLSAGRSMGDALRIGAQSAIGSSVARRLRSGLVIAEIALSMVFLVAAGLLVRSFIALESTSVGYDPTGLVSVAVDLTSRPTQADRASAEQSLLRALRGLPGVRDAALGMVPQNNVGEGPFAIETSAGVQPLDIQILMMDFVGSDYFRVVDLPLVLGRTFETTGSFPTAADEIIVNQAVARRLWGERSAVGARLRIGEGSKARWLTVVGVSADVRLPGKTGDFYTVQMYRPTTAADEVVSNVVLRVNTRNAPALERSVEQAIKAAGLSERSTESSGRSRCSMRCSWRVRGSRWCCSVCSPRSHSRSAALGLYGVIAYGVAQRSREIGLRVALGADAAAVARLILGGSLRLAALGCGIGIVRRVRDHATAGNLPVRDESDGSHVVRRRCTAACRGSAAGLVRPDAARRSSGSDEHAQNRLEQDGARLQRRTAPTAHGTYGARHLRRTAPTAHCTNDGTCAQRRAVSLLRPPGVAPLWLHAVGQCAVGAVRGWCRARLVQCAVGAVRR
jgi:hypothetical protein